MASNIQRSPSSPLSKSRYRVTNWRAYNRALVGRGALTLWIDEAVIAEWRAAGGKGRRYSDVAIRCALSLRAVFGLTLRQAQGCLASLKQLLGLTIPIPHHSTLCRRAGDVAPSAPARAAAAGPVHLAVDGWRGQKTVRETVFPDNGLKMHGEGEWRRRAHAPEKRRGWRKLHLGVDTASGEVLVHELTPSTQSDARALPGLLNQTRAPLAKVYGDKAYDGFRAHRAIRARDAMPVIPPRKGAARHPPRRLKDPPPTRGAAVQRITEVGRAQWKREAGYHRRSLAETAMARFKTLLSPSLKARTLANQKAEAAIAVHCLNTFTALGMPVSVKIA